nr:B3 domain-containing transcription repressor VAL1-like isoform X2 [Ziziphus jujuba var. spinosa]
MVVPKIGVSDQMMEFLCRIIFVVSLSLSFSMASSKTKTTYKYTNNCFYCKNETEKFQRGWPLRNGCFAALCERCGIKGIIAFLTIRSSAYEKGTFCDIFHLDTDGWRDCVTCGKNWHCGCIMSCNEYVTLDFGGISCTRCFKENVILEPNKHPSSPNATTAVSQKTVDVSEVELSVDSKEVVTGSSSVSALHCTSPCDTTVQPPSPTSLSQVQSAAAQGEVPCDTFVEKQTSKGDASPQFKLHPRNLPKIRDKKLQKISGNSHSSVIPLFEKLLTPSDADLKTARLVLPKKCAEVCFPRILEGQGLPLVIQDTTGRDWEFNFRFWQNCNSKMYVLEGIKDYMVSMEWQAGDTVTFYRMEPEGKLVIGTKKASSA